VRSKLDGALCYVGLQDSFLVKVLGMGSFRNGFWWMAWEGMLSLLCGFGCWKCIVWYKMLQIMT